MSNLVKIENVSGNQVPATTSLAIADFTGKEHKNVLQSIEILISSGKLGTLNFQPTFYKDKSNRNSKMYILDEKFTSVLLMGMTGEKALDWKIAYQEQFEGMRNRINIEKNIDSKLHPVADFLSRGFTDKRI